MATTNLNIRTDKEIKEQAEEIFNELGLNMTTAINIFLRAVIREQGIPFEIKQNPDPFYSKTNMTHVKKAAQELRAGKGTAHGLIEIDDE